MYGLMQQGEDKWLAGLRKQGIPEWALAEMLSGKMGGLNRFPVGGPMSGMGMLQNMGIGGLLSKNSPVKPQGLLGLLGLI